MGRKASHNWQKLFLEYNQGRYKNVAEYAKAKGIYPDQMRKEFRKLEAEPEQEQVKKSLENGSKQVKKNDSGKPASKNRVKNHHPWEMLKKQFTDWPEDRLQAYVVQLNAHKTELEAIPFEELTPAEIKELGQIRRERRAILSDPDPEKKCGAHNHDGSRCRNPAERGKNVCWNHGGAPGSGAKPGTQNNLKHGLFSKFIPEDDPDYRSFMEEMETKSTLDILWARIKDLSFLVARSVKIAWVKDKSDQTKVLVRERSKLTTKTSESESEWEIQHAWDKNNSYLTALAKIEKELDAKIKLYEELIEKHEKRGYIVEEHRLRVEKMKQDMSIAKERLEIDKAKAGGDGDDGTPDDGFIDALKSDAVNTWAGDNDD